MAAGVGTANAERGANAGAASATHVTGLNYMKSGSDPAVASDEAYPEWLWKILEPQETLGGYVRKISELKASGEDWRDVFSEEDQARYKKLARVARMKANNALRAKV